MKKNHKIIQTKAELKEWLRYERAKYPCSARLLALFGLTESDVIWKYQKRLRIVEYHTNTNHKIRRVLAKIGLNRMAFRYGFHIPVNACGKGLKIMHIGSILINSKCDVGEDCAFHINTALVSGGRDQGVPCIGNGVVIGVGAVLVGGVRIGNGVAIGANAVVNKSFEEDNIAIAGVPAKKISDNGSGTWNKGYIREHDPS